MRSLIQSSYLVLAIQYICTYHTAKKDYISVHHQRIVSPECHNYIYERLQNDLLLPVSYGTISFRKVTNITQFLSASLPAHVYVRNAIKY